MALQHSNTADAWTPADYGSLVNLAVQAKSVAFQAATVFSTDKVKVNFPLWVSDPTVAWYNELDPITATDGATGEVVVTPAKTAGIHRISSELGDDTDPAIADHIGAALANQIAEAADKAWLANTTAKANNGLLSAAYSSVDTGVITAVANLDPFIDAQFAAEAVGAALTSWVMHPTIAKRSKIKVQTGSNQTLLQRVEDGLRVAGLPVFVSPHVDPLTLAWGIPKARVMTVIRKGTEVVTSKDAGFYNDAVDIRAIARVGFGFLQPAALGRLYDAA